MGDAARKRVRTCVGCGRRSDKVELHRIVRTADARVLFDETGRLAGRGAYVCSGECLDRAIAKGTLKRALKCDLGADDAARVAVCLERALNGTEAR